MPHRDILTERFKGEDEKETAAVIITEYMYGDALRMYG